MKPFILSLLVIACGCTPTAYFKTPNDVYRQKGAILLNNGTKLSGLLTIPFEDDYKYSIENPKYIKMVQDGKTTEDSVSVAKVKGYFIDTNFYAFKNVFLLSDNIEHMLFVKRLTSESSRIGLYYLYQSGKSNNTGDETEDYFISLPGSGPYETINTRTARIIPDFDIKMSAIVSDCPALANKIRAKDPAYYFPFVTINRFKHRDVLLKIISEYNNCR